MLKSRSFRRRLSIHRRLQARGKLHQGLTSSWSEIPLVNLPKRLVAPSKIFLYFLLSRINSITGFSLFRVLKEIDEKRKELAAKEKKEQDRVIENKKQMMEKVEIAKK